MTWRVEYKRSDGKIGVAEVPDAAGKTALEVATKVEAGEVKELWVPAAAVIAVKR